MITKIIAPFRCPITTLNDLGPRARRLVNKQLHRKRKIIRKRKHLLIITVRKKAFSTIVRSTLQVGNLYSIVKVVFRSIYNATLSSSARVGFVMLLNFPDGTETSLFKTLIMAENGIGIGQRKKNCRKWQTCSYKITNNHTEMKAGSLLKPHLRVAIATSLYLYKGSQTAG